MGCMPHPRVTIHRDLVHTHRDGQDLLFDLYLPERTADSAEPPAVVLWLHGGGWFTGDRTLAPDLTQRAQATGMAFASIEYRLSGQALFPAPLHDVRSAVRHLRTHAAEYGIDPARVGTWGASAGGHLALLTALTGHLERLPGEVDDDGQGDQPPSSGPVRADMQAVAASYPPVDLTVPVNGSPAGEVDPGSPEARLIGGTPESLPEQAREASPLHRVTPECPPVQLSHGTGDLLVTHRQSLELHEALTNAGVTSELYLLDGYKHGFLNPPGRLDVRMAEVMDDGRLEAAGEAPGTFHGPSGAEPVPADFGFPTVDDFFRRHLGRP
ncbi:alpha/beta hydrolase [Kocuria soli]|uniref:Alpha/beta hydrolase n=2 Tax=Kocuria soli TaxID=2485125 RepID=A0A3N3ZSE5_9MICC|nr:alpha/beta hydrolase [Kocuria soli]